MKQLILKLYQEQGLVGIVGYGLGAAIVVAMALASIFFALDQRAFTQKRDELGAQSSQVLSEFDEIAAQFEQLDGQSTDNPFDCRAAVVVDTGSAAQCTRQLRVVFDENTSLEELLRKHQSIVIDQGWTPQSRDDQAARTVQQNFAEYGESIKQEQSEKEYAINTGRLLFEKDQISLDFYIDSRSCESVVQYDLNATRCGDIEEGYFAYYLLEYEIEESYSWNPWGWTPF